MCIGGLGVATRCLPQLLPTLSFEAGSLTEAEASQPCWFELGYELQGSSHLCLPPAEMTGVYSHAWLFTLVLKGQTQILMVVELPIPD